MAAFTTYDPDVHTLESLVSAILTQSAGVTLLTDSIVVRHGRSSGEPSTISFYDGTISPLNIGAGLLLTSGDPTPANKNTSSGYGVDAGTGAVDGDDADLQDTVDKAFSAAGGVNDVTFIEFKINVTDPSARGLRFEVVFGSEEYPEYSGSSFVDVAGVYVNGQNYALFENNPLKPLSVVDANLTGGGGGNGYFRNNTYLPIEYDGISVKLKITVPLVLGENTIKIAVADTGDSILDSGLFISSMQAVDSDVFGIAQAVLVPDIGLNDGPGNQIYEGGDSGTTVYFTEAGGGHDVYDGGGGVDTAAFESELADVVFSRDDEKGSIIIEYGEHSVELTNVERLSFGEDLYLALDTNVGETVWSVYALLNAWFDNAWFDDPGNLSVLSEWVARAQTLAKRELGMVELADEMIGRYSDSAFLEPALGHIYESVVGQPSNAAIEATLASWIGPDAAFISAGALFYYAAQLPLNTSEFPEIVGTLMALDSDYFS